MEKIVLIDGHSILNRAFYGIPELTNAKGEHTNAVYGFLNIMFRIIEEEKPQYITVAFDVKQPTFRHEMYRQYKGTRKPMPKELSEQVPMIKELLAAMGICIVEKPGFEADDILGTIAKMAEKQMLQVSLISGDRDLLQLASEQIKIRIPKTKRTGTEIEDYYPEDVLEKYQVSPQAIIDLKGLMGDTADNIPGVPGIGEKTATKIIVQYGSVENAIAHVEEITPKKAKENLMEFQEQAVLSKALATIKTDCEIEYTFENARIDNLFTEEAYKIMKRLEFKSMLAKFRTAPMENADIENCFQIISNPEEMKKVFVKMQQALKEGQDVSFDVCVEEDYVEKSRISAEKGFYEQEGQMSFFLSEPAVDDSWILAVSVGIDSFVYYMDLQKDKESEKLWSEILNLFFREEYTGNIVVLDYKKILYVLEYISGRFQTAGELPVSQGKRVLDLSVARYLLNPLQDSYEYDDLARDYLGLALVSNKSFMGKQTLLACKEQKTEEFQKHVCYQSYVAKNVSTAIKKELKETQMEELYWNIEFPLIYVLYEMEQRGISVNKEELEEYGKKLSVRIAELENIIYSQAGENFNINSPKQLGHILFEKLQLPNGKKTKTGYSTSAEVLEKLKVAHPIVEHILEYRQLVKLKSTYADGLVSYISKEDGRIHGTFNQTITATGRLSSTEPNLQNIPIRMEIGREIRKVFVPKEGYVFLDADYSQVELRILAHMSGDTNLIRAYNSGSDIHRITASQVFHIPFDEVTPGQRSDAKAVNFGIVYGISSFGLGQDLNISKKEAEAYIQRYFETYPGIKSYLDHCVSEGKEKGYVSSMLGRRRPVPELNSSNYMQRMFGERIAMNSPIQATAADIMKIAMIRVDQRIRENDLKSRLLLQVHDELLVETHKEEVEIVTQILEEEMYHAMELSVPLEVEVKEGKNWNDAH